MAHTTIICSPAIQRLDAFFSVWEIVFSVCRPKKKSEHRDKSYVRIQILFFCPGTSSICNTPPESDEVIFQIVPVLSVMLFLSIDVEISSDDEDDDIYHCSVYYKNNFICHTHLQYQSIFLLSFVTCALLLFFARPIWWRYVASSVWRRFLIIGSL